MGCLVAPLARLPAEEAELCRGAVGATPSPKAVLTFQEQGRPRVPATPAHVSSCFHPHRRNPRGSLGANTFSAQACPCGAGSGLFTPPPGRPSPLPPAVGPPGLGTSQWELSRGRQLGRPLQASSRPSPCGPHPMACGPGVLGLAPGVHERLFSDPPRWRESSKGPRCAGLWGLRGPGVRGRLSLPQGEAPPSRTDAWVSGSGGEGTRAGTVSGA